MFAFQGSMIKQTGAWFLGVRCCNSFISAFHVKTKGPIYSGYKHPESWQSTQTSHPMRNEGNTTLRQEAMQKKNLSQCWQQAWKRILKCGKFFNNFLSARRVHSTIASVVYSPERVSVVLKDKFRSELDLLEKMGIITPVMRATSWVNSFICITKANGSVRLSLDPRDLNKVIVQLNFVTPTFKDGVSKLHAENGSS